MSPAGFDSATHVTIEENQDAFTLALSQDETGERGYLILQCSINPPSSADTAAGLDTYCLLDQDGAVQYGGVTRAVLEDGLLTLSLMSEASGELGVDDGTDTIVLAVPPLDADRVAEALRRIFTYGNPGRRPDLTGI
ncbi:hypothetical protein KDK95_15800 [Actinospica sp. MGRD01-02]|uniref:Immunity protein 10 of polymorphic toxin system n=1 Tax=Actinospica acidithermotolerans TaxID=2828514 RepID=A0A941EBX7_9ACTN|nr:Imm10 family immunity protein [Actinospica acidithermotolerans]MBR7827783.1 hypothetical protein [Actinospica acidithermotolerans]